MGITIAEIDTYLKTKLPTFNNKDDYTDIRSYTIPSPRQAVTDLDMYLEADLPKDAHLWVDRNGGAVQLVPAYNGTIIREQKIVLIGSNSWA